jgi:predicted deacylase
VIPRHLLAALSLLIAACAADAAPTTTTIGPSTTVATTAPPDPTSPSTPTNEIIGTSLQGRDIAAITLGSGPARLYLIGGIHGDERPAVENSPAILAHLGALSLEGWTVRFVLDANPDGTAADTRGNAAGVDLNRNWPSAGFAPGAGTGSAPLSEPESAALAADISAFAPDLIVAMHAAREGPFVETDGDGEAWALRFAAGASSIGREWQVVPEVDWATVGSLGTYFGDEERLPVVTVEANRWDTPAGITAELLAGLDAMLSGPGTATPPATVCLDHRRGATCGPTTRSAHDALHQGTEGGAHGFIVKEVGGPVHAALNADAAFYPASVIKLVHLTHALRWISAGGDPANPVTVHDDGCSGSGPGHVEPLDGLLEDMMLVSDNAAANAIQAHFGLDQLEATISAVGMTNTRIVHGFGCGGPQNDPANRTTSIDLVTLLEGVVDGASAPAAQWPLLESLMVDGAAATGLDPAPGFHVLVKEGWYGTTLTIAGIAIIPSDSGRRTFVFAAYTDRATAVDASFTIAAVAGTLLTGAAGE